MYYCTVCPPTAENIKIDTHSTADFGRESRIKSDSFDAEIEGTRAMAETTRH